MTEAIDNIHLRLMAEAFLYAEADLLDDWKLKEWEALLADDAIYKVPPIGSENPFELNSGSTMFICSDNREMLAARIVRQVGKHNWAENPHSRLRRLISNVQLIAVEGDEVVITSNVVIYRIRRSEVTNFVGKYRHRLRRVDSGFHIVEKIVALDIDVLRGQGGISIIL